MWKYNIKSLIEILMIEITAIYNKYKIDIIKSFRF